MHKMRRARRVEHRPFERPFGAQVAFARVATGLAWTGLGALAVGASAAGAVAIGALAIRASAGGFGPVSRSRESQARPAWWAHCFPRGLHIVMSV
jgi:hypothetical protein